MVKEAVDASLAHLKSSVAWAQSAPLALPTLVARLATAAAAFDAGIAWTYSIFDPPGARVLGGVGLERAEDALIALVGSDTLESGYWLRADSIGRGYATEATAGVVELAFTRLGAPRVAVCHDPANVASEGVPRRLGFRCVGTIPNENLPGRLAADGSVRRSTKVWVLDAPQSAESRPALAEP